MELRPVEAIRAVGPVGVKRGASDIAPAFAVDGTGRLDQDSYSGSAKRQDRGLEGEDSDSEDEEGSGEEAIGPGKVDVLA